MAVCASCGSGLQPGARFCTHCGTLAAPPTPLVVAGPGAPAPVAAPSWFGRHRILLGALALIVLAGGAIAYVLTRDRSGDRSGYGATATDAAAAAAATSMEPGETFVFGAIDEAGTWALVSGTVAANGTSLAPDGVLYIARLENGRWHAEAPGTDLGRSWLCEAPDSLVAPELRELYLGPDPCH